MSVADGRTIEYRCECGHFESEHGADGCAGCDNGGREDADICSAFVPDYGEPWEAEALKGNDGA